MCEKCGKAIGGFPERCVCSDYQVTAFYCKSELCKKHSPDSEYYIAVLDQYLVEGNFRGLTLVGRWLDDWGDSKWKLFVFPESWLKKIPGIEAHLKRILERYTPEAYLERPKPKKGLEAFMKVEP